MSNRQELELELECQETFTEYENVVWDSESSDSEDDEKEDRFILETIEKNKKAEQVLKDQKQIQDFPVDIKKNYDWINNPSIEEPKSYNDNEFPLLLKAGKQKLTKRPKTSMVGFLNIQPKIFYGPCTSLEVSPVMCTYFLKGQCERSPCPYFHPIDVKCKFDTRCTNQKCVFVHSPRDNNQPPVQPTTVKCKFDTKCTNQKCVFVHSQRDNNQQQVQLTTGKPQHAEKCKHRICLNTLQIVDNKVVPSPKTCKFGDNCAFSHTIEEVLAAVKENQERFKCKFSHKCNHVVAEIYEVVINNKPRTCYKYTNKTAFCDCPRVHHKESINNFIVRVTTSNRRPQQHKLEPEHLTKQ